MWWFFYNLFLENKDALLALPTEIKTIAMIAMIVSIGGGIIRRMWKLVEIVIVVGLLYFVATALNFI